MEQAIRFHLDEHIAQLIADGLRRRGIDVTTTSEAGLQAANDPTQLSLAHGNGRVLVTRDADFLRLSNEGVKHCGIIFIGRGRSASDALASLVLLREHLTAAEMQDHNEFI